MDAKTNADSPAYPWGEHGSVLGGLTKRELFAAMAMQGIRSNPYWNEHGPYTSKDVAEAAVEDADALLAALAKDGE